MTIIVDIFGTGQIKQVPCHGQFLQLKIWTFFNVKGEKMVLKIPKVDSQVKRPLRKGRCLEAKIFFRQNDTGVHMCEHRYNLSKVYYFHTTYII